MDRKRILINGFGHIGRAIAKIVSKDNSIEIVHINDIVNDLANLVYLYNHDSIYRTPEKEAILINNQLINLGNNDISYSVEPDLTQLDWVNLNIDYLLDTSGINDNLIKGRQLVQLKSIKKMIITWSPTENVDKYIIFGVNHQGYDHEKDHILSNSICDVHAISHCLHWVDMNYGIDSAFITILHPRLSYQNLLDGPLLSNVPSMYSKYYALGRSNIGALIPKETSAREAVKQILPQLEHKIDAISYRTPTNIVSSADLTIALAKEVEAVDIMHRLEQFVTHHPLLQLNREMLISIDYIQNPSSAILDHQWTRVLNNRLLKIVLWYDNEWGYSNRACDLIKYVAGNY